MLKEKASERLRFLAEYLEKNKQRLVIDGDTHPTNLARLEGKILEQYNSSPNYYHGRPINVTELLKEMQMASVDMALIWQNPAAIEYSRFDKDENYQKLLNANSDIAQFATEHPDRFIPGGWTDPKALGIEKALELAEVCVTDFGFPIIKMNPAQNHYYIDSPDAITLAEKIISLGATPAFHFGGDSPYTSVEGLEKLAEKFSNSLIIGVHMGGGGSHYVEGEEVYLKARELGLRRKNIFFILSAKRDCHMESDLITYTLAGEPYMNNLACGSDAPYGRQAWNFGGFNLMFKGLKEGALHNDRRLQLAPQSFSDKVIQGYLGRNLAEVVIQSCKKIQQFNTSMHYKSQYG